MNKIIIDGKEYELSDELAEKIKAEVALQEKAEAERLAEQNPFARVKGKPYFFVNAVGKVSAFVEGTANMDDELYSIANYCRDKELMEQRALHETLNPEARLLKSTRRFWNLPAGTVCSWRRSSAESSHAVRSVRITPGRS